MNLAEINLKDYERLSDALKRLNVNDSSLRGQIKSKFIRSIKLGENHVYVNRNDVDKYAKELPERREAARALQKGDSSVIHAKFPRKAEARNRVASVKSQKTEKVIQAISPKFWNSEEFKTVLKDIVSSAVEEKLKALF